MRICQPAADTKKHRKVYFCRNVYERKIKMNPSSRKYQIDTEENRKFLRDIREGLLRFGHSFPSPGGSAWDLGEDASPWKGRPRET